MNAAAFRHFYNYHFSENHKLWDSYITSLSQGQFTEPLSYSRGSIREQILHLIECEDLWFSELRGVQPLDPPPATEFDDRDAIRAHWDNVEQRIRVYLTDLRDEMLFAKPIEEPEDDKNLIVWQVLLHVVNHATDHRAQILRSLNDMGMDTKWQDYIFYVYDHPVEE